MRSATQWFSAVLLAGAIAGCGAAPQERESDLRVGYFPNLTHAQALVGMADGSFKNALGDKGTIKPFIFNAGPAVIEALFAGGLDLAYIGPNPAINGYVRSGGTALKIIAGATSGGAVLVVRPELHIQQPKDFAGRKIATPQLGNTQDVALRHYLLEHQLQTQDKGGSVQVIPMQNPDILTALVKKEIDGAWVPEPWGARLIVEGAGELFLDERTLWPGGKFVTANVIARTKFLREHPELVKRWLRAHVEVTEWIAAHPEEAKTLLNREIENYTGKKLKADVLNQAWSRLESAYDPLAGTLFTAADAGFSLGFLGKTKPDLSGLYDVTLLNQVLLEKKLPAVSVKKE